MEHQNNSDIDSEDPIRSRTSIVENFYLENESETTKPSIKELTIAKIMEAAKTRENLVDKNKSLQYLLSMYIKESADKDYFQTLDLPLIANEKDFTTTLKKISDKKAELEVFHEDATRKLEFIKAEIQQKQEDLSSMRNHFSMLKEKVSLQAVNSENGECFTKDEVQELLKKEEKLQKTLEYYQVEAIKKRHILQAAMEDKRNLVEGPVDYGEYEIMCTKTENNAEIIKQLKQEIKEFALKSANVVNALSHLNQKLFLLRNEKSTAEDREKLLDEELDKMRKELFKEKTEYNSMCKKNKDLQHKCILLQHPRLLEDHKNIVKENEDAKKEIETLKDTYQAINDSISS